METTYSGRGSRFVMRERRNIPGVEGSSFESLLTRGEQIQRIPRILFLLLLLGLAGLAARFKTPDMWLAWGVYLADYVLMAALPRFEISFGSAKPQALLLAIFRSPFMLLPSPWNWLCQGVGSILVICGFYIEPQRLVVTESVIRTQKLKLDRPIRIVHIGDLHLSQMTPRDRKLVSAVHALRPDVICFSGDILSYSCIQDHEARQAAKSILASISAPLGVFAVAGSPPVDTREVLHVVYGDTAIKLLDGERTTVCAQGQEIELSGLSCSHDPERDGRLLARIPTSGSANFRILLYHSPDLAPFAAKLEYDLQLSGHTHGGQVRLPFFGALYTSSIYGKRFESGRYQVGTMDLVVTRGLGLEGKAAPRVRLFCPPEIVLLEISSQNA